MNTDTSGSNTAGTSTATPGTRTRTNWRRLGWELLVGALLIGAAVAVWYIQEYRMKVAAEEAQATQAANAENLAAAVPTSLFEGFAAGLVPALRGGGGNTYADLAVTQLLGLERIRFAHVFLPDGTVLATSDRKLEVVGHNDGDDWVLAAEEVTARQGSDGLWEVAGPIGDDENVAILWLGIQ